MHDEVGADELVDALLERRLARKPVVLPSRDRGIVERGLQRVAGDGPRGERIVLDGRHLGTGLADQPEEDAGDLREMSHDVERGPLRARALRAPLVGGNLRDLVGDPRGERR